MKYTTSNRIHRKIIKFLCFINIHYFEKEFVILEKEKGRVFEGNDIYKCKFCRFIKND